MSINNCDIKKMAHEPGSRVTCERICQLSTKKQYYLPNQSKRNFPQDSNNSRR